MEKNIVLVGFMGTGKTTIARLLAQRFNAECVDLDMLIEEKEGMSIVDIFKTKGEPYFRKIEKDIVSKVSSSSGKVIACGGGVVLDKENVDRLKNNGLMICLTARPEIILTRTKSYSHRPLLNVDNAKVKIKELLKKRQPYYTQADYTLDTSDLDIEGVVKNIRDWIEHKA